MTNGQESCASRRAILKGAPALAVIAAVGSDIGMPTSAAETGIALASVSDPYVALAADWHSLRNRLEAGFEKPDADALYARWIATEDKMAVTRATTTAGALAGLRIAHSEFLDHFGGDRSPGGKFVAALITSAIAVLDRENARG